MKPTLKPLAAAVLLALTPNLTHANEASPFSQFVVFGDSLSDAGQFPDPLSPLSNGVPTGGIRFTNRTGPTYGEGNVEYTGRVVTQRLAEQLGLQSLPSTPILPSLLTGNPDGTNYAVGGYRTDQILDSIVGTSRVSAGGLSRTRPGYLVDNPRVDPNTLFYLNGGGNDFLQGINTLGQSIGNLVAGVGALQAAGARYIVVSNLPLGRTPLSTLLGNSAVSEAAGTAFNAGLADALAAQGGNYVLVNTAQLMREVRTDLARFGFDPTIDQAGVCFNASPAGYTGAGNCIEDPTYGLTGTRPDPTRLLYNDAVHPTEAVQQINADFLYSILSAPWQVSLLPELGRSALAAHLRQLDSELSARRGQWQPVGEMRLSVQGAYHRPEYDGYGGGEVDSPTVTLGASQRLSEAWLVGASLGLGEQSAELGAGDSEFDMRSYLGTLFARYERHQAFAQLTASAGYLDFHDLERTFALGISERSEKGDTDGWLWGLGGKAGFSVMQPDERLQFGPFVGADYQRIEVEGYRERGSSSTALAYSEQTLDSLRLALGLFGEYALGERTRLFGEVAREVEREDDRDDLSLSLNSVPGNTFELPGAAPIGDQTRFSLGLAHQLAPGLALRANYHYRGNEHVDQGVGVSLSIDL